jgi:hypothetical protein
MDSDWFLAGLIASAAATAGTAAGAIGSAAAGAAGAVGSALTAGGATAAPAAATAGTAAPALAAMGPAAGSLAPGITAGLSSSAAPLLSAGGPGAGALMTGAGTGVLGGTATGGVVAPAAAPASSLGAPSGGKAIMAKLFGKDAGAQAPPPGPIAQAGTPALEGTPGSTSAVSTTPGAQSGLFSGRAGGILKNLIDARTTIADPLAQGSPLAQFTQNLSPLNRSLLAYTLKRKKSPSEHVSALGNLYARF